MILLFEPTIRDHWAASPDEWVAQGPAEVERLFFNRWWWLYHSYNTYSWAISYHNIGVEEGAYRSIHPSRRPVERDKRITDFKNTDMPDPPMPPQYRFGGWVRGSRMYAIYNMVPQWTGREKPSWWKTSLNPLKSGQSFRGGV